MGNWAEAVVVCAKHPDETPQPGICPSCLRERLSRIIGIYSTPINYNYNYSYNNNYNYNISASSPSPPDDCGYYSATSSGKSSPPPRHQRVTSDVIGSIYQALGGRNGLKKSRSMANYVERDEGGANHNKKRGFWNKLLLRSNRTKSKLW